MNSSIAKSDHPHLVADSTLVGEGTPYLLPNITNKYCQKLFGHIITKSIQF
jgi:hypothetical protein